MVLNGILYVLVTGYRCMDIWKRILEALISNGYSIGRLGLDGVAV